MVPLDCGCYFEYEPDHSKPYFARWVLCGNPNCFMVQGSRRKAALDQEIKECEARLESLKSQRAAL